MQSKNISDANAKQESFQDRDDPLPKRLAHMAMHGLNSAYPLSGLPDLVIDGF